MRYLGVDYGSKRVGLALSDEAGTIGFPHSIIENTPKLIDELCALISEKNIEAVVIGESVNLSGEDNPIAKDARAIGTSIVEGARVPVFYESEVYTSAEARRPPAPSEGESAYGGKERKSRTKKSRARVDSSAASLILTSYLSRIKHE